MQLKNPEWSDSFLIFTFDTVCTNLESVLAVHYALIFSGLYVAYEDPINRKPFYL